MMQKTLNYFIIVYQFPSALLHIAEEKGEQYTKRTGRVLTLDSIRRYAESLGANTYTLGQKAVFKVATYDDLDPVYVKWAEGAYQYDQNTGVLTAIKRPSPQSRGVHAAAEEATISKYGYMYFEEVQNASPATT